MHDPVIKHFPSEELDDQIREAIEQAIIDCGEMVPMGIDKATALVYNRLFEGVVQQVITWVWEADLPNGVNPAENIRAMIVTHIERMAKIEE